MPKATRSQHPQDDIEPTKFEGLNPDKELALERFRRGTELLEGKEGLSITLDSHGVFKIRDRIRPYPCLEFSTAEIQKVQVSCL